MHWRSGPGLFWLKPVLPASAGAVPWSVVEDLEALQPSPCTGALMPPACMRKDGSTAPHRLRVR